MEEGNWLRVEQANELHWDGVADTVGLVVAYCSSGELESGETCSLGDLRH